MLDRLLTVKNRNYTRITKILVTLIFILIVILLISTSILSSFIVKEADLLKKEDSYRNHINDLLKASDHLTYQIFNYVETGDEDFLESYLYEIDVARTREKAVAALFELGVSDDELFIITNTLDLSNELSEIEFTAIDYIETEDYDSAQNLIFSDTYTQYKDNIYLNYNNLERRVRSRVAIEAERIISVSYVAFSITILVGVSITVAAVMLLLNFLRLREERDIDQLTGLFNRNKYKQKITNLIERNPDKYGALICCDIDNLKFINECYGHKNGDIYISNFGEKLKIFKEYDSVIARPSGDDFIVYIHNFDSIDEVKELVTEKLASINKSTFETSIGVEEKIRFSSGISIYPKDADDINGLIKYADYTMRKMKKISKGESSFYNKMDLEKNVLLLSNKGYLDHFIEKELLDFAMQPIVTSDTFEIYGYEALMRPQVDVIKDPQVLLELAKEESKEDKVERLVMRKVFEKINKNKDHLKNCKIFINSIADQKITDEELSTYIDNNSIILKNIIIELTEQNYVNEADLGIKSQMFRKHGALIALDDYGTGFANGLNLISGDYDIVKVDMKIIENIDKDEKRQEILKAIIKVSNINNYKVLAEGVETIEQIRELQKLGVHYLQGYFFGKPELDIKKISIITKETLDKLTHNPDSI